MMLKDKRVLITGGARGLGRTLSRVFSTEGALVAFSYIRDEESARETVEAVRASGGEVKAFKVSVLDVPGTEKMVKEIEDAWGGIDILVNNAGISQNLPIALMEEEDWDRVMDINVKGTFLTSKAVLRGMIRRKTARSEEHTSELQSRSDLVCRLLLEKKKESIPGEERY